MSLKPLCQQWGFTHVHGVRSLCYRQKSFNWALGGNSRTIHPTIHYAFNRWLTSLKCIMFPNFFPPLLLHSIFPLLLFKPYRSNNVSHESHTWSDAPANSYLPSSPPGGCISCYFSCKLDLKSVPDPVCTVAQWELFNFIPVEWFIMASWWHFKSIICLTVVFDSHFHPWFWK